MRMVRLVVHPFVLAVLHARQDLAFCCSITLQLIGDDHARNVVHPFEQLAEKSLRGLFVALALHKDIEHISVLIHRWPQIMSLATDGEEDLIQVPCVATARARTTPFIGRGLPTCEAPLPHRFRGHDDAALGQKFLNRTENGARSEKRATQRG